MDAQYLADDLAVRSLANAYSHAVSRLDSDAAAEVYAVDGVLSAFRGPDIVGRAKICEAFHNTFDPLDFLIQTCAAGMVKIDGDRATATWSVTEWFKPKAAEDLGCCFGMYEDQAIRTAEGWRFARRRFHPFYRGMVSMKGKRYDPPQAFGNDYAPWPFLGLESLKA